MSKKNKNFGSDFRNDGPEVYNMDDIGYMTDEALYDRANRLENDRNRAMTSGRDPYLWEVEIAYLRREQTLRQTRADLHQEFLKKFMVNPKDVIEEIESADQNVNAYDSSKLN